MNRKSFLICLFICAACSSNKSVIKTAQTKDMTTNLEWIKGTNVYEVNVRQYTPEGTFNAFAKHLPRLKDMGVHTLWFMPVTPIAQKEKKRNAGQPVCGV